MNAELARLLATLRDRIDQVEADWRRRHLPPPTRDRPRPEPEAVAGARLLEEAGRELDAIAALLRNLPPFPAAQTAENDAALMAHGGFLLALLELPATTAEPLSPGRVAHNVAFLRELMQRRSASSF